MNLQKLAFQLDRRTPSYCFLFTQQAINHKRQQLYQRYGDKLRLYQQRHCNALSQYIETFRNRIFEYTLEKLQKKTRERFPEIAPEAVNSQVKKMYEEEEKQVTNIKENDIVVEAVDQEINNRKMKKEDEVASPLQAPQSRPILKKAQSARIQENKKIRFVQPEIPTDRSNASHQIQFLEERLNSMLELELNIEAEKHRGPGLILEDDPDDLINKCYSQTNFERGLAPLHSDRHTSLPSFTSDSVVHAEPLTSGRTELRFLELMLRDLLGEEQGFSSRRSVRNLRIRKDIMQRLYDYQGKLKMDLIKRAFDNIKKDL